MRRALFVFVSSLVSAGCEGCRREPSPAADAAVRPLVDLEVHRRRADVPAIAAAAVTRDAIVFEGATGEADVTTHRPARADTPFPAASIAKLVVAACAAELAARGTLDPEADVADVLGLPSPGSGGRRVTIRMLLEHTSGLVDDLPAIDVPRVELAAFVRSYAAREGVWSGDPEGTVRYSNAGTTFAAFALERRAAVPFEELARRTVLAPLGATSATFRPGPDAAVPHVGRTGDFRPVPLRDRAVFPAAGLLASAHDLARFARMLLGGGAIDGVRVLAPAAIARMLAPGLGVQSIALGGDGGARVLGHEGEDEGVSAALVLDPARGTGAVVLANGDAFSGGDAARARALVDLLGALLAAAETRME